MKIKAINAASLAYLALLHSIWAKKRFNYVILAFFSSLWVKICFKLADKGVLNLFAFYLG